MSRLKTTTTDNRPWIIRWDENYVEVPPYRARTLAGAIRVAKGMDERFRLGATRGFGGYHDSRTGITIERVKP